MSKSDTTGTEQSERIARRGQQIFQIALRMEIGDVDRGRGGAETLLYLADAIARIAATSQDPHLALKTVVELFGKIDDGWFATQKDVIVDKAEIQLADAAFEIALGPKTPEKDVGSVAAGALAILADAIVRVATLNREPRQIIEYVVRRLDETDVDAIRREQLK